MKNIKMKNIILLLIALCPIMLFGQTFSSQPENEAEKDAFERLRVSNPTNLHDIDFIYDRRELVYDTITTNGSITHDVTNRNVDLSLSSAGAGSIAAMQSFQFFKYQTGKSQLIKISFNMNGSTAGSRKFAGYSDGNNGVEFIMKSDSIMLRVLSDTDAGDEEVLQANWNIDPMDGTGTSGDSLDWTKTQLLVIDFQALYVGRVRVGFNVGGELHYVHEFLHSNLESFPYLQTASLPIRVGVSSVTAGVTANIDFICASVISEGGQQETYGEPFSTYRTINVANGVDSAVINLRPKLTFNSIENRGQFIPENVVVAATGANPVLFKIGIGQEINSPVATDVNVTHSMMETVTGIMEPTSKFITLVQGIAVADNQQKSVLPIGSGIKIPMTLSAVWILLKPPEI